MRSLADAACELPWLAPCAGSLVALTRDPRGGNWSALRNDPGLVLLLARQSGQQSPLSAFSPSSLLKDPGIVELAIQCLDQTPASFADWRLPQLSPIFRAAISYASMAEAIALTVDNCDAEAAWVGGLLAPLGWLAAGAAIREPLAVDVQSNGKLPSPHRAVAIERFFVAPQKPPTAAAAIGRRLATAWRLPTWLGAVVGHLGLPLEAACALGADSRLFSIVQLAVTVVDEASPGGLQLAVGATRTELVQRLELTTEQLDALVQKLRSQSNDLYPPADWQAPTNVPLLSDLLRLAAITRENTEWPERKRLQEEVDALHDAVQCQRAGEELRLKELKLRALAELAAGAGHEINNPLAVISGQAQYLLAGEQDPSRRKSLQTIVGQTQRIHQTLTQLMQFAKPPAPRKQHVDLAGLLSEASTSLQSLADERQVRLTIGQLPAPLTLDVDPGHIRSAVSSLLRNAVEAAPAGGWATGRVEYGPNGSIEIIVEDNGPGLKQLDREHLFDPFYSGRKAGRGRGLGLPTAWQLARQNGGDVRLDAAVEGLTRFVLSLPPEAIKEITSEPIGGVPASVEQETTVSWAQLRAG